MKNDTDIRWNKLLTICVYGNAIVVTIVALYFFLIPFGVLVLDIRDPALHTGEMPHFVYRWHQELSGKYETWARDRVASGEAAGVNVQDISGTDHSASIVRASRAFEDTRLDPQTGLPAYIANSKTGFGIGPSRGVGISYMLIWAPELWPNIAQEWYARYDEYYWQDEWFGAGFREFSDESLFPEWFFADVDAGPVIGGRLL